MLQAEYKRFRPLSPGIIHMQSYYEKKSFENETKSVSRIATIRKHTLLTQLKRRGEK